MSVNWDWLVKAFDLLAEFFRSMLPWSYRQGVSNWLVFACLFVVLALIFSLIHVLSRPKHRIAWEFERTGLPIVFNGSRNGDVATWLVVGVQLHGKNTSGHDLHQFDGEITLHRSRRKLPIYVFASGWQTTDKIDRLPPRGTLTLGAQFVNEGLQWEGFDKPLTPGEFLSDFGAFSVEITVDGERQTWSFELDQLREAMGTYQRNADEEYFSNAVNVPSIKMKAR